MCVRYICGRDGDHEDATYLSFNSMQLISWSTEAVGPAGLCSWE